MLYKIHIRIQHLFAIDICKLFLIDDTMLCTTNYVIIDLPRVELDPCTYCRLHMHSAYFNYKAVTHQIGSVAQYTAKSATYIYSK